VYDPLGRRIAKKVNGIITQKYLWQGLANLLAVYDGSNNLLMRFEYADDRLPVAMIQSGSTFYLTYDQVGSLRIVADPSGNVVKRIDYDSFGNIIKDTDPAFEVPFGFAGGLYDQDTGLVQFGYREYDPDTGRWTAKDPILFDSGNSDLYRYCINNPVNLIDPWGLSWRSVVLGATSVAFHTAALATVWNPALSALFKTAGSIATLGTLANAYYEYKTCQISKSDLMSTVLVEAGNLMGGKLAGKLFGTAGEVMFNGITRSSGVARTAIDTAKTISIQRKE
jgi:RHS repeat-associated protein